MLDSNVVVEIVVVGMMQLTDLVLVLVMCGIIVIYVYSEPATNTEVVIKTSSIDLSLIHI